MISEVDRLHILLDEVNIIKSRIQPHDTGHLHTTVNVLNERIEEVSNKLKKTENNGVHSR